MPSTLWSRVDSYICDALIPPDHVLERILAESAASGLPDIAVSPAQGRMLEIFARMAGARRILEIGTLGGYSTVCLARALPAGGRLVTLEADPHHAEVARANIAAAGFSDRVELREGRAVDSLPALVEEKAGPFDLVFIDADKPSNPDYLFWSLRLSRPGTLIVADNVIRDGAVADADSTDPRVIGTRRMFEMAAAEPRLLATAIQTVGVKGYDGFALMLVGEAPAA